jgi:ABC-type sugar transport system ATPase subunit
MIAGLEDIVSSNIVIDDVIVNELPPKARDAAMVFQNYALYPHMTVAENMGLSLRIARVSRTEVKIEG